MRPHRALLLWAYVAVALMGLWSEGAGPISMAAMLIVTAASAVSRILVDARISVPLVWEVGFLAIIGASYLGSRAAIPPDITPSAMAASLQLLVVGHAVVVVVVDLASRSTDTHLVTAGRMATRHQLPATLVVGLMVIAMAYLAPSALASAQFGRSASFGEAGPINALGDAVSVTVPTLAAVVLTQRGVRHQLFWVYVLSAPMLVMHFLIGTRYLLLIAAVAPLIFLLGTDLRDRRARWGYVIGGVAVIAAAAGMLAFRVTGVSGGDLSLRLSPLLSDEGIIESVARLVQYFNSQPHLLGGSALSIAVFAIPRSLWPEKPTLIGYWFPREYGLAGFSEYHSISFGYVADGYADFGLAGVVLYSMIIGVALSWAQRFLSTNARSRGLSGSAAALVVPAVIFGVRSPVTALITMTGILVVLVGLRILSWQEVSVATDQPRKLRKQGVPPATSAEFH